jgi:hypothetical protein
MKLVTYSIISQNQSLNSYMMLLFERLNRRNGKGAWWNPSLEENSLSLLFINYLI